MDLDYRSLAEHWMRRVDEVGLLAAVDEIAVPSMLVQAGMGLQDVRALRARFGELAIAFPDSTVTLDDVIVDGQKLCLVLDWQGTHLGPLRGFPPTGRPIRFEALILLHMDGFLVQRAGFFAEPFAAPVQLGIIPPFDDPPRRGQV